MSFHDVRLRFPHVADGAKVMFSALEAASRPVEDLTISEWADRYRMVSAESGSPWPGEFRTDRVPYLREPQNCLHPDHPARRVTARWAAQLGKSTAIENWFGFIVDRAPGAMMIVMPTLDEAMKFNRFKLDPTIDVSKKWNHKVRPANAKDEKASTSAIKRFTGGSCSIVNAGSSKGLQMVTIKYLAMDEVTGYPRNVDGRGSPRDQARARLKILGDDGKEWQSSTPGVAGECVITADFEAGDRRYYYVPCPHCGAYHPLQFEQMRPADPAQKLPVHMRCPACDGVIVDGHKRDLLIAGVWIPRRVAEDAPPVPEIIKPAEIDVWRCDPCEGRCRDWQPSYHLWAAYSPGERFATIWEKWQAAQGDTAKLRTFFQQDLGEPYDPGGKAIEWEKIVDAARGQPYARGRVPADAGLLVSAADVQGYGLKWVVYAIGPRGQRWLIDREVFEGKPDQEDEPWIALADALGRRYPTAGGGEVGIDLSGVDSGWLSNRVYRFCANRPNCFALDGREPAGLPWLGTPVKKDIKDRNRRIIAKALLYPVGLYDVKTEVVAGLANFVQGPDKAGRWPRSTLHLTPELCDEEFAKEITGECLVDPDEVEDAKGSNRAARRIRKPNAPRKWTKVPGRKNDWFDATVYATALAWHLEHRRKLTEARWADLLLMVHGKPAAPDLFDAAAGPFERKVAAVSAADRDNAKAARREKWKKRFFFG